MKSVEIAMSATVVRLRAGHVRGENSLRNRYVVKKLKDFRKMVTAGRCQLSPLNVS